jgi:hypothetical protein
MIFLQRERRLSVDFGIFSHRSQYVKSTFADFAHKSALLSVISA